ncbi:MAG: barstar family protein [Patescibacteria group bacterium]
MRSYTIDGNNFNGVETFYDEITSVFAFPDYFGRNLDAVYDCLTDIGDDVEIIWLNSVKSKEELSRDTTQAGFYGSLIRTLAEVPDLTLILK